MAQTKKTTTKKTTTEKKPLTDAEKHAVKVALWDKLAENRVHNIMHACVIYSKCANKSSYYYEDDLVAESFVAIRQAVDDAEACFFKELKKNEKFKFSR